MRPASRRGWKRLFVGLALLGLIIWSGRALLTGPVQSEWIAGKVAAYAQARSDGSEIGIGNLGLSLDVSLRPVLHLRDVRVKLASGDVISANTVEATTDWSTLLGRSRKLTSIFADHVLVEMVPGAGVEIPDPMLMLGYLEGELVHAGLGSAEVSSLTVMAATNRDRRVTLLDRVAVTLASPSQERGEPVELRVAGRGDSGPWSANMTINAEPGGQSSKVAVVARSVDVADLARRLGDALPFASGQFDADVSAEIDRRGRVLSADGQLSLSQIALGDRDSIGETLLHHADLTFAWDPAGHAIMITPSSTAFAGGSATLAGRIEMPQSPDTVFRYNLAMKGVARVEGSNRRPADFVLDGTYDPAEGTIVVNRLAAQSEQLSFTSALRVAMHETQPVVAFSGAAKTVSVDELKAIWPEFIITNAHNWVRDHLKSGTVTDASIDLGMMLASDEGGDALPPGAATVAFDFEDVTFDIYDGGPIVTQASGHGVLQDDTFTVTLKKGVAKLPDGQTLDMPAGTFHVPVVTMRDPDGSVELDLEGTASAMLALWQSLPLSKGNDLGVAPADLMGTGSAHVSLAMPLIKDLPVNRIKYTAQLELRALGARTPFLGHQVSNGEIDILIADNRAKVTGHASVDGVDTSIEADRPLDGGEEGQSAFKMVLDEAARKKLGLDMSGLLSGNIGVTVKPGKTEDGKDFQDLTVDLKSASLSLPTIGWSKPKGDPATASFRLFQTADSTQVEKIVFDAGVARAEGSLRLDDGRLVLAKFPLVRLSRGDKMQVSFGAAANGGHDLFITGAQFDARGFLKAQTQQSPVGVNGAFGPINLQVRVDNVLGNYDEALDGVNLDATILAAGLADLSLTAQTSGGGATSATMDAGGDQRRLMVEASETGRLLRFLGFYTRVYGGRTTFQASIDKAGRVTGRVDGQRWKIVGEPALARLASEAPDPNNPQDAREVQIRRLLLDLSFADGRVSISDGMVRAANAGLSLQGDVDFRRNVLRITGSYFPAGTFDNFLSRIPILGQTLFASGRAGLVGVTYHLSGPISEPQLSINPLSVVAPGILRKLFELG
ncbi:DUF748 domain-containing protein [Hartmannibacter diazotrophicus]|uniref:YhdP family protein n=1 Tax=Hartmannibacter diazotrophicus TaxID=1482074 RepID=UPI00139066F6|nr:DUF748 domain-containing protein [Hartmannibacter diazotrophicus]